MKKYFFILCTFLFVLTSSLELIGNPIKVEKKEKPGGKPGITGPRAPEYTPISADIENNILSVSFDYPMGTAVITVEGVNGNVYYSIFDTDVQTFLSIETFGWEAGDYTLNIDFDEENGYEGHFIIE